MEPKLGHCRYCGLKSLKVQYDQETWYYIHENGYVQCPIDGSRLFIDPYTEDDVVGNILSKYGQ